MCELSSENIEEISFDVRKNEITFSHLSEDLIDHICCDVEDEMAKGVEYTVAYNRVKEKMGSRRLKEIQEETLYAVDTKYRNMKKIMKITGITGIILLGLAPLFKIQHWPFAGIMLSAGTIILALFFLPPALGVLWKETHSSKRLFLFIAAFLTGIFFLLGILFKVQHWPGAGIIITLSYLSGILLFVPALFYGIFRDPLKRNKRRVLIMAIVALAFYMAGALFGIQHWPLANILHTVSLLILFLIVMPWYTWITWRNEDHVKAEFIYLVIGSLAIIIPSLLVSLNIERSDNRTYSDTRDTKVIYRDYCCQFNGADDSGKSGSVDYNIIKQVLLNAENVTGSNLSDGNMEEPKGN